MQPIPPIPHEWRQFVPAALLDAHDAAVRDCEISAARNGRVVRMGRWLNVPVAVVARDSTPEGRVLRTMEAVARELIEQLQSERLIALGRDDKHVGELKRIYASAFRGSVPVHRHGLGSVERCFTAAINFADRSFSFSDRNPPIFHDVRLERPGNAEERRPRARRENPMLTRLKEYVSARGNLSNRRHVYRTILKEAAKEESDSGWHPKTFDRFWRELGLS
ncbi:MAG: hypothetical protein KGJ66_04190 [Alphaproteobacteria bacterium]|nr:hypothetical protein [Alphaproteobacteria bacterium]